MSSNTYIIYHASCADGFTAAWVVYKYAALKGLSPEGFLHPAHHRDPAPDVTGKDVVIVDFSYPADVLREMATQARSIIVMDHHKTVSDEVKDLDFVIFDNDRSGAGIAWDYFHGRDPAAVQGGPREGLGILVDYIEDRDLWVWGLKDSKEVSTAISLVDMDMAAWTAFAEELHRTPSDVVARGATVLQSQDKAAKSLAKKATLRPFLGHEGVPVVNATGLISEIGHMLLDMHPDAPFSAMWFHRVGQDGSDLMQFSLRSRDDRVDVGELAVAQGGGGHRNAAGFSVADVGLPLITQPVKAKSSLGPWLQTYTGKQFPLESPSPDAVDIQDIAHALSQQVRYNGHTEEFYSVAQHSVICSYWVPEEWALCALLHDATEAYLGDIPSPVKRLLPSVVELEDKIWREAIAPKFGLPLEMPDAVKMVDLQVLKVEVKHLVTDFGHDWGLPDTADLPITSLVPIGRYLARDLFMNRFHELTNQKVTSDYHT